MCWLQSADAAELLLSATRILPRLMAPHLIVRRMHRRDETICTPSHRRKVVLVGVASRRAIWTSTPRRTASFEQAGRRVDVGAQARADAL